MQHTLWAPFRIEGIGLRGGESVAVEARPADVGAGRFTTAFFFATVCGVRERISPATRPNSICAASSGAARKCARIRDSKLYLLRAIFLSRFQVQIQIQI
jgi:hypothetical protein